jgi:hypothetical protein
MEAVTTALMGECLGVNLPIEGPLQVKFRIEYDTKSLKLNKNGFQVGAKGSLLFGDWSLLDPLQNIDLHIQVNSPDTQSLSVAINQQLPELNLPLKHICTQFPVNTGSHNRLIVSVNDTGLKTDNEQCYEKKFFHYNPN